MYEVTAGVEPVGEGRRVVCTVPLPVAPQVVWDAVATGEGISSWFVPCALEPQVGGRIVQFADPGAPDPTAGPEAAAEALLTATVGEITEYTPPGSASTGAGATGAGAGGASPTPGRFTYAEHFWMGEDVPVPPWETSCDVVDDGEGGTLLTLRSGFDSGGTLADESVDGSVDGWRHALTVLAHRLTHRPADAVVTVDAAADPVRGTVADLWSRVTGRLVAPAAGVGAAGSGPGDDGEGTVARAGEVGGIVVASSAAAATIVLSAPADGVLELYAFPAGESPEDATGGAAVAVRVYEYVDAPGGAGGSGGSGRAGEPLGAAAVDAEPTWDAPRWREWLSALAAESAEAE